jgi:FkbM family methyltransferase
MSYRAGLLHRAANRVYEAAFPIYRPIYAAFKAVTDKAERQLLAETLKPGSVVVDAGANIGIYSQFLSTRVGPDGVVHSFEPHPSNFERLQEAVGDLSNVRLNKAAVSNESGPAVLYLSETLNVDHRTYPCPDETRVALPIRAIKLDDYFKPDDRVDLIKLDIQGYELHALRGATRLLADNLEIKLLFEFWPYGLTGAGSSAEQLTAFLLSHNFCLFTFDKGRLRSCLTLAGAPDNITDYQNIFAKREAPRDP